MSFQVGDLVRPNKYGRAYYAALDDRQPNSDTARRELIRGRVVRVGGDYKSATIIVQPIETGSAFKDAPVTYVAEALELIDYRICEEEEEPDGLRDLPSL